jgi:hypothetical protein
MTRVATLSIGESQYDDRFWQILEATGLEREEFEGLDYFSYVPFFVIAGATVAPRIRVHGDHTHFEGVTIDVPDGEVEFFYDALPHLLAQITGDESEPHEH